jgi:hypothetical protein
LAEDTTQQTANTSGSDGKNTAVTTEASTTQATADKTYTQAELQAELDRIAAKTRNEEREKAKKAAEDAAKAAAEEKLKADGEWQKIAETAKAEADQLRAEVAAREKSLLRQKVAAAVFGKNADAMAPRLMGETEEELTADAKVLLKSFAAPAPPDDLGRNGGGKPDPTAVTDADRQRHAQQYASKF